MPTVKTFQDQVSSVEMFDVKVRRSDGVAARASTRVPVDYSFTRAASSSISVSEWRRRRIAATLPGFDVDVVDAEGNKVHGRTLLANVRAKRSNI